MVHGPWSIVSEGHIAVPGGQVWYRVEGGGARLPLVVLHGGPGFPHDYLEPLAALGDERPVVFYDQLGCGRSERPDDAALWTVERFVQELEAVLAGLALERLHLFGHSWGSILAVEYALRRPPGLASLVLASPAISMPRWVADQTVHRARLPAPLRQVMERHEAAGDLDSPEYQAAVARFYQHHLCRLQPWPEPLLRSIAGAGEAVYRSMWGPNEFTVIGSLAGYDRADMLEDLDIPTLLTCGRFDEATPEAAAWYASLLPRAEMAVFEVSAHVPHLEEPTSYVERVRAFLRGVESLDAEAAGRT